MNVACPRCQTVFRVDPARVPDAGVRAKCTRCGEAFRLTRSGVAAEEAPVAGAPAEVPAAGRGAGDAAASASAPGEAPAPATPRIDGAPSGFPFGPSDPDTRAKRIARALVSDIVAYNAERRDASLGAGTVRHDFREEILKSWDEYVEQVGLELAKRTPYFRNALNEILARGQNVF